MPKVKEKRGDDYLWIHVTPDKYEFPLFIADNLEDFAKHMGKTETAIRTAICHAEKKNGKSQYRRVKK